MKKLVLFCIASIFFYSCQSPSANEVEGEPEINVIPRITDEVFDFGTITTEDLEQAVEMAKNEADERRQKLLAQNNLTFDSIMREYDRMHYALKRVLFPLELLIEVHPEESIRNGGKEAQRKLNDKKFDLELDEEIYNKIKAYSETEEAGKLTGFKQKFLKDVLLEFKQNGMKLSVEDRKKLKSLKAHIDRLGTDFRSNIGASNNTIEITDKDTAGMDPEFLAARKTDKGTYELDMSYPTYGGVMAYANDENLRKKYLTEFYNRGMPDNLPVLDSILYYRLQLANLLGYDNYSQYAVAKKMTKTPETVWEFENALQEKLQEKAQYDYDQLLGMKAKLAGSEEADLSNMELNEWEISYLLNKLKETEYQLNSKELSEYFEFDKVMEGLFTITQNVFGLRYEEVSNPSVWHPEVRMFNCYDKASNELLGRFYLDMYPRENKYSHAAMFTISGGILNENGQYHIPEAALVCNFPKPEGDKPSLLKHRFVETFFHEFGHLIHGMVTKAELSLQSGPESVVHDFVEAPSQIYENWAFQKKTLSLFAKHYETGETIPDEFLEKLVKVKNLYSGLAALRQCFYGCYDFTLHNKYVPFQGKTTTDVMKELKKDIMWFGVMNNTHFQAAFGHLVGYGSGYYGYMWSKVYAQDMWSVFEEKGVMNPKIGRSYREKILEPSGSRDAYDMVVDFLGREPNNEALLKELGVYDIKKDL